MTKIRIVQIAAAVMVDKITWQYLDDKGRVWLVEWKDHALEWSQLDLPEEPEEGDRE